MTSAMDRAMASFTKDVALATIDALSEKYGFSVEEATRFVGVEDMNVTKTTSKSRGKGKKEKKVNVAKAKFAMPWTGVVDETKCKAIKNNGNLFTQCMSEPTAEGERYCLTCNGQAEANGNGKPSGGTVEDRKAIGPLDYVGPKNGVKVYSYANFLLKKGISIEDAKKEAERLSVEIPEYQWDLQVRKRGRPSKKGASAAVSDTSSGSDAEEAGAEKTKKTKKTTKKTTKKSDDTALYDAAKKKALKKKKDTAASKKLKKEQDSKIDELTKKHLTDMAKKKEENQDIEEIGEIGEINALQPFTCSRTGEEYMVDADDNLFQNGSDKAIGTRIRSIIDSSKFIAKEFELESESESETENESESENESEEE